MEKSVSTKLSFSEDFMLVLRPGDQETRIRRLVRKYNLCGKK